MDNENRLNEKTIFNQQSKEDHNKAKVLDGSPDGIMDFNGTNHSFFTQLYKQMIARTWFPEQVNISKDKINYPSLIEAEKRAYDLVLAQLIANDSIQANQLADRINSYITSPIINATLIRQSWEEVNHSLSYAVMAEDICQDTPRIYYMHREDEELGIKNQAVENMYNMLYKGINPTKEDMLLACTANQILEELVFPGGFVTILSLDNKLPGSAEMIKEIMKDETLSHVPLFRKIFRTILEEEFNNTIPEKIKESMIVMIKTMVDAEKRWTKYVTKGLLGFTDRSIDIFVEAKGNSVCSNLKLDNLYKTETINPLQDILNKNLRGGKYESRTNFFEANATEYSKASIKVDY